MKTNLSKALLTFMVVLIGAAPASTQDNLTCPALVEEALAQVGDACAGIGRNQACYGNTLVTATTWDATTLTSFTAPGDTRPIADMASLATAPFSLEQDIWGIAVLALQANLPDTLPGQNVTFVVYGDVTLQSEVPPDVQAQTPPTCMAAASGGVNLRSGPGTGYAVVGGLVAGDQVTVTGRDSAGDWLRLDLEGSPAWVSTPLLTLECDVNILDVVEVGDTAQVYTAPMQAFRFTAGIGQPQCDEAPRDGLLVQAPKDTTVHFLINGIELEVGSTALLNVDEDNTLQTSTFDGTVSVTSAGETQTAEPGFQVTVSAGAPPAEPEPYDYEAVRTAPVGLLPEPVSIPVVLPGGTAWLDTGITLTAGQAFTVRAGGIINVWEPCEAEKASVGQADTDCATMVYGPNGNANWGSASGGYPLPGALIGALVARIGGGPVFHVGEGGTFVADAGGALQFTYNDDPALIADDAGAFAITVEVGG